MRSSRLALALVTILVGLAGCDRNPVAPDAAPSQNGSIHASADGGPPSSYALASGLLISPIGLDFGDVQVGTTSSQQVINVTNIAMLPVLMSGVGGGAANSAFNVSQSCQGATLSPGQMCKMFVQFTPAATGAVASQSVGTWNGQAFSVGLRGNGVPPRFLITPAAIDFGQVLIGTTSQTEKVTITNSGLAPVVMSGAGGGAADSHVTISQNCQGTTIAPGGSCQLFLTFAPTAEGDVNSASVGTWNGQDFNVPVHGIGVKPTFRISPTSLDFGEVRVNTTSPAQVVTVTNLSTVAVHMNGVGGGAVDSHYSAAQSCQGQSLAPGASCQEFYTFTPTDPGALTTTASGSWNNVSFAVGLHGVGLGVTGLPNDKLRITPAALDFGDVTVGSTSPTQSVLVTNVSGSSIVMGGVGGGAADSHFSSSQSCQGQALAPGASCQQFYTFRPTATGAVATSASGSWNNQQFTIALSGNGRAPLFRIDAAALEFGDVQVGSSSPTQSVTVTSLNPDPIVMNGIGGGASTGNFNVSQSCQGITLTMGTSCQMLILFQPTTAGVVADASTGSWNGQSFRIQLHGNAVSPRFLITPYALDFGLVPVGVTSPAQQVNVINAGLASVVMAGVGGGASRSEFNVSQDCQSNPLAPGQACRMYTQFTPTSSGLLTDVSSGTWNAQPFEFSLQGTGFGGVDMHEMDLSPATISLAHTSTTSAILLSTTSFDATTVTTANVRMLVNGVTEVMPLQRGGVVISSTRDWNGDGLMDRMFTFQTSALTAAGLTTGAGPSTLTLRDNVSTQKWQARDSAPPTIVP